MHLNNKQTNKQTYLLFNERVLCVTYGKSELLGWQGGLKGTIFSDGDQGGQQREVTTDLSSKAEDQRKTYFAPTFNIKTNPTKLQDSDKIISLQFLRIITKELVFMCSCLNVIYVYLAVKGSETTLSLKKEETEQNHLWEDELAIHVPMLMLLKTS